MSAPIGMDTERDIPPKGYLFGDRPLLGQPAVEGFTDGELCVRIIPKDQADTVIREGHYSASVAWSSCFHFGIYWHGLIGAIQFGPAMNPASGARIVAGTTPRQWLELNRMWMCDAKPVYAASRAIGFSIRLLRRLRPELAWIQSFADGRCGKLGAVYQAAGFLYCGSHETTFLNLDGEWFHQSLLGRAPVDRRGWGSGPKAARLRAGHSRATRHVFSQYRYIRPLRPWARRNLILPVLPYPKSVL